MLSHLTQPNQRMTWNLDFTANDGREWAVPYTFELEPVMSGGGRKGWRSKSLDIDDDVLFEHWCNKQRAGRTPGLYEAISVFKDELYGLCMDHISAGDDTAHWLSLLGRLRDDKKLDVERAKNYPIEELMRRYGLEPRMGFVCCPFHGEDTPSLKLYPNTNSWYCFGCGVGGDTIDFVRRMNKCGFAEAVRFLS